MPACPSVCGGSSSPQPTCVDGQWTCPALPAIECASDASLRNDGGDAASDGAPQDATRGDVSQGDAGSLPCGPLTCEGATQYCSIVNGHFVDGATTGYTCMTIPVCDAGSGCACVASGACFCDDEGGTITVTCDFP